MWSALYIFFTLTLPSNSEILDSVMPLLKFVNEGTVHHNSETPDESNLLSEYDFIIVGAGTAGCVLANRLTEIQNWKILLIEAGDNENFMMDIPMTASFIQFTPANWRYKTEPSNKYCSGLVNKQCVWPRGKVLGGSSVLNFMIYTRGSKEDYENWKSLGNDGWGWQDVLPYFKKIENFNIQSQFNTDFHSKKGLLNIDYAPYKTEMGKAWVKAAQELGFNYVDYNGANPSGVSNLQLSMKNGTRHSSNRAYLNPIKERSNLHVSKNSFVTKLLLDDESKTAKGVELEKRNKTYKILAKKEVILSAGVINSPQLLMLSGIGPQDHLKSLKIKVVKDLPVGTNLMDHIATGGFHFLINSQSLTLDYVMKHMELTYEWMKSHTGPLSLPGGCEALVFMNHKDKFNSSVPPDVELMFISGGLNADPKLQLVFGIDKVIYDDVYGPLGKSDAFMIFPILLKPKSKGRLLLRSRDPNEHPKIIPNYFEDENDMPKIIEAIKVAIEISKQPALKKLGVKLYDVPIKKCLKEGEFGSDAYFACQSRTLTFSVYHQCGTCKMGPESDNSAVVDTRLKVHGVKNLRVVDSSIMPEIVSGHINAPTFMIAEKGADMIKQDWGK